MTSVLLVDWLGRGGIAQSTEAWKIELERAAISCAIVTRPGRELPTTVSVGSARSRLGQHHQVVRAAVRAIRVMEPRVVVIQNHTIPPLEVAVDRAARHVGAAVVRIVHDHVLHSRSSGSQLGLRRAVERADVIVAHSQFVATELESTSGREVGVLPLPLYLGIASDIHDLPEELEHSDPLALQFGVVKRAYKGTEVVLELAREGLDPWKFAVIGSGAPAADGVVSINRYLESSELAAAISVSDVSLFPYRKATQSGGVLLAQMFGSVPIATAVGGLPEQIHDGVTGRLLALDASIDDWRHVLLEVAEQGCRQQLAAAARAQVEANHNEFRNKATVLLRGLGA